MRILVIDDDPTVRAMLIRACAVAVPPLVASCDLAQSDDEALRLLRAGPSYDLALVGIDGQGRAGMQIFRHLLERSLRIPRIALTDGRDLDRIRRALVDGAVDFLVKPLVAADVAETVGRVMTQVARRRRNWHERAAYSALRREVDLAADLQRRVLPANCPQRPGLELHAHMRPARGIGGDFYDVFEIDDARLGFVVADVSGKGVPAAFYMAIASTALRSAAQGGACPGDCLSDLNEFLVRRDVAGMFVSVFYGVIDTDAWTLECSNAGHPPPFLILPDADPAVLDCAGGPVVGALGGIRYEASRCRLPPGGVLVSYTDGVTEAMDAGRRRYGARALAELLTACRGASARDTVAAIDSALHDFAGAAERHDDLTTLALRRLPAAASCQPRAAA